MSDVVVQLPMRSDAEHALFGDYLSRFMAGRQDAATHCDEAPFVIVHSEPTPGAEMKVVTFQERAHAWDFSRGWSQAVRRLGSALTA